MINKDTKIYGSFSANPGNNGCIFFNTAFEKYNINAIYKSFYADNLENVINAVKTLHFSGFALSMPFKIEILKYLDDQDSSVSSIGSANTVVVTDKGHLIGYNTDFLGVIDFFEQISLNTNLNIIGTGGFSKAIQYACKLKNIEYKVFNRNEIYLIDRYKDEVFFNATPADIVFTDAKIIDGRPFTEEGKQIANYQAKHQFKIYTNLNY